MARRWASRTESPAGPSPSRCSKAPACTRMSPAATARQQLRCRQRGGAHGASCTAWPGCSGWSSSRTQCRSPLSPDLPAAAIQGRASMAWARSPVARPSTAARRLSGAGSPVRQSQPVAAASRTSGACARSRHSSRIHSVVGGCGWPRRWRGPARHGRSGPARYRAGYGRRHGPRGRGRRRSPACQAPGFVEGGISGFHGVSEAPVVA